MKRKYLDELGVKNRPDNYGPKDHRKNQWAIERSILGFDERETWDMKHSFYCWLYERLMMYKDINFIDFKHHQFLYDGEILTHGECIDRMIEGLKIALLKDDYTKEEEKKVDDIAKIWAVVLPVMWW